MSFLARVAARAMGVQDDGVGELAPKDQGLGAMRAAAPVEDAPDEAPEPETGPASRLAARRASAPAKAEPEDGPKQDEAAPDAPARAARASADPPKDDKDEKAVRQMWRAAAEDPEQDEPEIHAPAARAATAAPDGAPPAEEDLPEATRNEKAPQKALAMRDVRRDGERSVSQAAPAAPPVSSVVETGFSDDGGYGEDDAADDWRPLGADEEAAVAEASAGFDGSPAPWTAAEPSNQPPSPALASVLARPVEQSGVVIEQIDVFVHEPASRETARPRLSDPSRAAASRYLRTL
ncbi:hypothetical protein [Methylopila sp. M107]|uniref:hypothetical protein n=1 Tax=Methylopila sp. M107 TaxID=1101190 RepID=UPI00036A8659|nr:hypothetical protein [Methylopila sp. M107]